MRQTPRLPFSFRNEVVIIFDWLGDIFSGIGSAIGDAMDFLGTQISNAIWDAMLKWFYEIIYGAIADFFEMMGNMGADVFDLEWVKATVKLFTLFGWGLFVAGTVVAVFDVAIEYQCGRANVKTTALNIIKGFFACSLIGVVPIELYKFCISLQNTFSHDLARIFAGTQSLDLAGQSTSVLQGSFMVAATAEYKLFNLLAMIAFAYCIIKIFFQNIKRGGILLVQMSVGALYMFSVPRGYADGFNQWCKQVVAICLTAFMQTTLLFLGLLTFPQNMLLGLGIMLAANEVPRIAQQFGLDSSVRVNMMSVRLPMPCAIRQAVPRCSNVRRWDSVCRTWCFWGACWLAPSLASLLRREAYTLSCAQPYTDTASPIRPLALP